MKAHETILVFYKKLPTYNPQKTFGHARKVSSAKSKLTGKESELYNKHTKFTDYDSTERFPRSVLKFASDKQKEAIHSTQKPVALLEYLIKTYSNEGDLVLDNVAGSGSTGIAAFNMKRDCILIEKDSEIFSKMKERLTKYHCFDIPSQSNN
jgi:site-specific DNA-methyltransferase (adenine-specific)